MADGPAAVPEVRAAEALLFSGEVCLVTLNIAPRVAGTSLPHWTESDSILKRLDDAAAKSLKKAGLTTERYTGFEVVVPTPTDAMVTVLVLGYSGARARSIFSVSLSQSPEGELFERKMLDLCHQLRQQVGTAIRQVAMVPLDIRASWTPRPGLLVIETASRPVDLRKRAAAQQQRQRALGRMVWILGGGALIALTVVAILLLPGDNGSYAIFAMYPVFFLLGALMVRSMAREADLDARSLSDEADISELVSEVEERRAQKQLQVHSHEVERYYELALRQRRSIFSVGVLCIVGGFGAVAAAFFLLSDSSVAPDTTDKVVIATLGVVSGVLANFVAVMFLRMFTATVASMTLFHTRLVKTHHVHIGNVLAAKVRDPDKRDAVLADMAHLLASDTSVNAATSNNSDEAT